MLVVNDWVDAVSYSEGCEQRSQVLEGHSVEFFGARLFVGALVLELESRNESHDWRVVRIHPNVNNLIDLPDLDYQTNEATVSK